MRPSGKLTKESEGCIRPLYINEVTKSKTAPSKIPRHREQNTTVEINGMGLMSRGIFDGTLSDCFELLTLFCLDTE